MKYYVYAIKSKKDSSIYVGLTNNLERRIKEHNQKRVFSTKFHIPYFLIYYEECENRVITREREKYWKSGTGKEKLKAF